MKKFTKLLALIISAVLALGVFAGCGGEKQVHTGDKFTYWATLHASVSQTQTSYNDLLMYQEINKATGTEVEFIHPTQGTAGNEAFQILLASGDFPDMIEYNWASGYPGGPEQAIADGVIIKLNDYLEDYAPNYYNYMEGEGGKAVDFAYKSNSVSSEGNYYGFKALLISQYRGFGGLFVRKDMLDKWGLDIPQTIDDWTNVFKVAKENGVKYPLTGTPRLFKMMDCNVFNTAWEVGKSFYLKDGKVAFGPFQKEYKDYLAKMAEWGKAGYIDIDFITNGNTELEAAMTNGNSVASFGYVGGTLGKLMPAMAERNPDYNLAACPYPVMNKGDEPIFQEVAAEAIDPCVAISTQCGIDNEDRYKEAIKWCDYLYSKEGMLLKSFGIEGNTYTIEKGEDGNEHYVYTDVITDHEKIGAHSIDASLHHFMRPGNGPGFVNHADYLKGYYPYDCQKDAIEVWNKYVDVAKKHSMPFQMSYSDEEASKKAEIEAKTVDNLQASIYNIILGKASIDSFDDAIKTAKKAGFGELIKIQQAAYDRYVEFTK